MSGPSPRLLFFPQWQGRGPTPDVHIGAEQLLAALAAWPGELATVVLSNEGLAAEHGINAYRPLLTQWRAATALLDREQPARLLLLAGDCAAEIAPVHYLNQRYGGELTVLWLDAHADLNTPASSPSGNFHGMPLRLLLDGAFAGTDFALARPLSSQQVLLVGLRDTDPPEDKYLAAREIAVISDQDFAVDRIARQLALLKPDNLYIHLDLDILSPDEFPALACPTAGGVAVAAVTDLLRQLVKQYNVVGMSLTETTATSAAHLLPIQPLLAVYAHWLRGAAMPAA